jgi:hypothetical protein
MEIELKWEKIPFYIHKLETMDVKFHDCQLEIFSRHMEFTREMLKDQLQTFEKI